MLSRRQHYALSSLLLLVSSGAFAGVIQNTTVLPPTTGYAIAGAVCMGPACLVNPIFDQFAVTSSTIQSGDQIVDTTAVLRSDVFQNVGGVPGTLLGSIIFPGTVSFVYVGRNTPTKLGNFPTILTAFQFSGSFNGNTLVVQRNAAQTSSGFTQITEVPGGFLVESSLSIYAESSINGQPFVPGPQRELNPVNPIPEPATTGLMLSGLLGFAAFGSRKLNRKLRSGSALGYDKE